MADRLDPKILEAHARVCKTMAHPVRLALLNALRDGERKVGDLAQTIGAPQPLVSQHLAALRNIGLLRTQRLGSEVRYRVAYPKMIQACDLLREVLFEHIRSQEQLLGGTIGRKGGPVTNLDAFLGQDFELPEDRLYDGARHCWLKQDPQDEDSLVLGVSAPGVALTGGLLDLELFPQAGDLLVVDEEIAFCTTGRNMTYFLSPVAGLVREVSSDATADAVNDHPYETWLVKLGTEPGWEGGLLDAESYASRLELSERATVAAARAGQAGKSSPTCRSIYTSIKEG